MLKIYKRVPPERFFCCEKLDYALKADVLTSYPALFSRKAALKIFGNFPGNYVSSRVLLLVNFQYYCSEQRFHIKMTSPRVLSLKFPERLDYKRKCFLVEKETFSWCLTFTLMKS